MAHQQQGVQGVRLLQMRLDGGYTPIALSSGRVSVSPIGKSEAEDEVVRNHYSGTTVWSSNRHFGVYFRSELIGAIQYGPPMNPRARGPVEGDIPGLELNRFVLSQRPEPNIGSRAISMSLKLLPRKYEWVQTFADERCGKGGALYQSCSFDFLGSHSTTFYELDGRYYHRSCKRPRVDSRGWRCGPSITYFLDNIERAKAVEFRQFRYFKARTKLAMQSLRHKTMPYPKI